jgi:hypothetical protein
MNYARSGKHVPCLVKISNQCKAKQSIKQKQKQFVLAHI